MVFVERPNEKEQLFNIGVMLRKKETKGDVGIEIEVEGQRLPNPDETPAPWKWTEDHSLRGIEHAEYVLGKPIPFDEVDDAIDKLWKAFGKKKSILDESNRTSVHVHLNVQPFHLNRLASLVGLWFALEDVLTEFSGDHRVGNLFCLRASDAHAVVSHMKDFIQQNMNPKFKEQFRYAAMNPHSIQKYGSLEIRTFRGATNPEDIKAWVGILRRLYDYSGMLPDPREICGMFSAQGGMTFFETVLGEYAPVVRQGIRMDDTDIRNSIFSGIRRAQDVCYCRDWSVFEGIEFKPDPFGRSANELLKRLQGQPIPVSDEVYENEGEDYLEYDEDSHEPMHPTPVYNHTAQAGATLAQTFAQIASQQPTAHMPWDAEAGWVAQSPPSPPFPANSSETPDF